MELQVLSILDFVVVCLRLLVRYFFVLLRIGRVKQTTTIGIYST